MAVPVTWATTLALVAEPLSISMLQVVRAGVPAVVVFQVMEPVLPAVYFKARINRQLFTVNN